MNTRLEVSCRSLVLKSPIEDSIMSITISDKDPSFAQRGTRSSTRTSFYETRSASASRHRSGHETRHLALDKSGEPFVVNPPISKFLISTTNLYGHVLLNVVCSTNISL